MLPNDEFYLVDAGTGVGRRLEQAGLPLHKLRGIFITHLHSDHTVDLASLGIFGLYEIEGKIDRPIPILGPGNRGMLPPLSKFATEMPEVVCPENPTPGTAEMFVKLMEAYATDLNDRIIDSRRANPLDLFAPQDIEIPAETGYHPNDNMTPECEPFLVFEDEQVKVYATLVEHPPIAPGFGFRFETAEGSVAFSGDTTYTPNMITLSKNVDLLMHEAIDFDFIESLYGDKDDELSRASKEHHYKSHTSVQDAVKVAQQAGARRLALHHLVPGLDRTEAWEHGRDNFDGEFFIPEDLDAISFAKP